MVLFSEEKSKDLSCLNGYASEPGTVWVMCQKFLRSLTTELFSRESDKGLTLETSALKLFPVANLRYQLSL